MTEHEIQILVKKQRHFFYSGVTLDVNYRIHALKKLKSCIQKQETAIIHALKQDLGKSRFEGYMLSLIHILAKSMVLISPALQKILRKPSSGCILVIWLPLRNRTEPPCLLDVLLRSWIFTQKEIYGKEPLQKKRFRSL